MALNHATLPFTLALANKGAKQAMLDDVHLLNGLNVCCGKLTYKSVADAQGLEFVTPKDALELL
jgi:alanine dehydrogenase